MSTAVTAHLKLRTPVGRYEYVIRRRTDAIVFVRARIESSDGETFDKAMWYLHAPWRPLSGILPDGQDSSSVLRSAAERDASSSLRSFIPRYESLLNLESHMHHQQSADRRRTEDEESTFHVDEFLGSEDSESGDAGDSQLNARDDALDKPELDVGLESDPMRLPSLETMAMPCMRVSHARNTNTKHARRALELTKQVFASNGRAESDNEETCDGMEPALPNLRAILADKVASVNSEQRRIHKGVWAELVGGM